MGFTFDDTNEDATPIAEMERLIAANPKNRECIFPYLGGEEVNNSPTHAHHRYVINFGDMIENAARSGWPELLRIVEEKVKPERLRQADLGAKEKWWLFIRARPELAAAVKDMSLVLGINCGATPHMAIALLSSRQVFANTLCVIALQTYGSFAALQCRIHEAWARFFGSSMKDDLRYTPTDCFETFPFPKHFEAYARLEAVGKTYYEFRADLMVRNNEGLTKTYNRFHDPDERCPDIKKLRELHAAMDRAVLDAYGWTDLQPTHEFILDYEEDDDEDDSGRARRRKKPYRYRWPDDFRDEVLARLLRLNQERSSEEGRQAPEPPSIPRTLKKPARRRKGDNSPTLFDRLNPFNDSPTSS
jgi:hypothetical protein